MERTANTLHAIGAIDGNTSMLTKGCADWEREFTAWQPSNSLSARSEVTAVTQWSRCCGNVVLPALSHP